MSSCLHQCLTLNNEIPVLPHLQLKSSFNLLKHMTVKFTERNVLNARHTYHTCITCCPLNLIFIVYFHSNWLVIRNHAEERKRKRSLLAVSWIHEEAQESLRTLFSVTQLLCNPKDFSLPGSSVPGIILERILEWVVISPSRGSPGAEPMSHVSPALEGRFLTTKPPGKTLRTLGYY